jgi:hypothetical protein
MNDVLYIVIVFLFLLASYGMIRILSLLKEN